MIQELRTYLVATVNLDSSRSCCVCLLSLGHRSSSKTLAGISIQRSLKLRAVAFFECLNGGQVVSQKRKFVGP